MTSVATLKGIAAATAIEIGLVATGAVVTAGTTVGKVVAVSAASSPPVLAASAAARAAG